MRERPLLKRLRGFLRLSRGRAAAKAPIPRPPILDAYSFRSPFKLAEMKQRLEAGASLPWWEGDSAYFDYLGCRIGPGARMLRLYPEDDQFVLHVRRGGLDDDLRRLILETLLPLLDAEDVTLVEGFD
ncbi:MAG TPA: hypothetical protein VGF92_17440 [Stellaceae bacterium]|jgi:hypothetical protein